MMNEKINILIVEDDKQIRDDLAEHLTNEGYETRSASDGNEAIPLIHGRSYHAIILDLKMPYIDGFGVLQFVKSTYPRTKVIILTAYGDIANIEKCKAMGADEIIGKPYDLEYLFYSLKNLVEA